MTSEKCPHCSETITTGINTGEEYECPNCRGVLPDDWFIHAEGQ